jgi:leucyl-tRNA synthetase
MKPSEKISLALSRPEMGEEAARNEETTLVVQVNGKLRDRVTVLLPRVGLRTALGGGGCASARTNSRKAALATEGAQKFTEGLTIRKVVVVPGRLVDIVAS